MPEPMGSDDQKDTTTAFTDTHDPAVASNRNLKDRNAISGSTSVPYSPGSAAGPPVPHRPVPSSRNHPPVTLYCDLDGTLTDFVKKVQQITGHSPGELSPDVMWNAISRHWEGNRGFYACLEWMPDGWDLWCAIRHLRPAILSGLPRGKWASPQKRVWCARELGPRVPVYTCFAPEKPTYSRPGAVLIDDSANVRAGWERHGGIFVHHTSTPETLVQLRDLGLIR